MTGQHAIFYCPYCVSIGSAPRASLASFSLSYFVTRDKRANPCKTAQTKTRHRTNSSPKLQIHRTKDV